MLTVENLTVRFGAARSTPPVVDDVSFEVEPGQVLALVGESGSGKTLTGKAVMGLLPRDARVTEGRVLYGPPGREIDLRREPQRRMRRLRGARISMIFQEPMSALSPLHTVGRQVDEVLRVHGRESAGARRQRVLETFDEVGFPDPERAWSAYPFELSGGLRQRAMIAMAMVSGPELVIADEPTTALDVTTQATVLELLRRLQVTRRMSVIMITHDLGVVANLADTMVVLRRGKVVERGLAETVLASPGHGYTRMLMKAAPRIPHELAGPSNPRDPILTVAGVSKTYPGRASGFGPPGPPVRALADVDLALERGRTLAVVGESGSGKSTLARLILRAERPDPGARIEFRGRDGNVEDISALSGGALRGFRRRAQMVFQDPYAALSPRMSIQDILTEPMAIHRIGTAAERRERAAWLMERVGLPAGFLGRYPFAFSGGQRQRIAIARALALEPELLVLDEPTSALDVSVQAEVLELLSALQGELGLSFLFISHDLAVVARLADRVVVMRDGRIVEEGSCQCIFRDARHPYTRALIAASPEPHAQARLDLAAVAAGAGHPEDWPEPYRFTGDSVPALRTVAPGHMVRAAA